MNNVYTTEIVEQKELVIADPGTEYGGVCLTVTVWVCQSRVEHAKQIGRAIIVVMFTSLMQHGGQSTKGLHQVTIINMGRPPSYSSKKQVYNLLLLAPHHNQHSSFQWYYSTLLLLA
jgi:hypothetical protein